MCGMTDSENRRYVPRPFMRQNCSGEISKVFCLFDFNLKLITFKAIGTCMCNAVS